MEQTPSTSAISAVASVDPYWAIHEAAAPALTSQVERLMAHSDLVRMGFENMQHEVAAASGKDENGEPLKPYQVVGKTAVLSMSGPMTKNPSCMSLFMGGASTVLVRKALQAAAKDPDVDSICLVVDSPGGQVSGTADLASSIERVRASKPVYAYAEDMCASAAYWVSSSCDALFCNKTAMVGSIGTYMVLHDTSRMAENAGVQVHVVRAGKMKGAGTPGTPITGSQLHDFQRTVNQLNSQFVASVSTNRRIKQSDMEKIADGRVHVGSEALKMGLVDGVCSLDDCLRQLSLFVSARAVYGDRLASMTYNHALGEASEASPNTHTDTQPGIQSGAGGTSPMTFWDQFKALLSGTEVDENGNAPAANAAPAPAPAPAPVAVDSEIVKTLQAQISALTETLNAQSKLIADQAAQTEQAKVERELAAANSRVDKALHDNYITVAQAAAFQDLAKSGKVEAVNAALDVVLKGDPIPQFSNRTVDASSLIERAGDAAKQLHDLAVKRAQERGISYVDAMGQVASENKGLAAQAKAESDKTAAQNSAGKE